MQIMMTIKGDIFFQMPLPLPTVDIKNTSFFSFSIKKYPVLSIFVVLVQWLSSSEGNSIKLLKPLYKIIKYILIFSLYFKPFSQQSDIYPKLQTIREFSYLTLIKVKLRALSSFQSLILLPSEEFPNLESFLLKKKSRIFPLGLEKYIPPPKLFMDQRQQR